MDARPNCPRCGSPLPAGVEDAQCPRCLLRIGLDTNFVASGAPPRPRPEPPPVAEIARDFPELEIEGLIGQGGMSAVYKARQRSLDRVVALKILTADAVADPAFAERFAREARALAALDHPNIVRVHDSGRAGGRFFLLLEHVDGGDLRQLLRAARLAPRESLAIVAQVCDALQYAHDRGVVHRDIKPENILVDRSGRVKIADFGLAKLVGQAGDAFALTGSHQAMGTPHYMAPEQIERPQSVDHRADIYSLGVVLYELLTGELPLGRFVPPSRKVEIDVRLDEVVLKALEKEVPRRFQHVSEVKASLNDVAATPRAVPPAPDARAAVDPRSGHKTLATAAVVLVVAAVGCLVAGFLVPRWFAVNSPATRAAHYGLLLWPLIAAAAFVCGVLAAWKARPRSKSTSHGAWPAVLGFGCLGLLGVLAFVAVGLVAFLGPRDPNDLTETQVVAPLPVDELEHTALCTAISDAATFSARVDRMKALLELTRRPGLTPHEQRHLANELLQGGFFEDNADALISLVEHQSLHPEVVRLVRKALRGESPSPHRERTLEALAREEREAH